MQRASNCQPAYLSLDLAVFDVDDQTYKTILLNAPYKTIQNNAAHRCHWNLFSKFQNIPEVLDSAPLHTLLKLLDLICFELSSKDCCASIHPAA